MTMYIHSGMSRKELIPMLSGATAPNGIREVAENSIRELMLDKGLVALWTSDPRRDPKVPNVVLVPDEESKDLIAWLWSYVPDFRPVTAFTRLLDPMLFAMALRLPESPSLGHMEGAWLGLIIAEAVSYLENKTHPERVSPNACTSTGSFAQARAAALGYDETVIDHLGMIWGRTRTLSAQSRSPSPNTSLRSAWAMLRALQRSTHSIHSFGHEGLPLEIASAIAEIVDGGSIRSQTWEDLTRDFKIPRDARGVTEIPRETRVQTFQTVATQLLNTSPQDERAAFVVAFLASQVSPGSIEHIHLLALVSVELPSAYYWYGILAGLLAPANMHAAGEGLGRRISRELTRRESVFDRPNVDIDQTELGVALGSVRAESVLRGTFPGYLSVGLLPGVSTIVRMRQSDRPASLGTEDQLQAVSSHLRRLEQALVESQSAYERLVKELGMSPQRSLPFSRGAKRK